MKPEPSVEVAVLPTAEALARTVADRLLEELRRVQDEGRTPSVVLTGGTIADRVHHAAAEAGPDGVPDWSLVEFWFGDERFVPADDSARNALQAREALLSRVPVDPARVHEMPSSDGAHGNDVDAAARAYAEEVRGVLGEDPRFDLVMLGIGPDGHCASLFPGHEGVQAEGIAVAVRSSPKPPPTRISLTMDVLGNAEQVWFLAAGSGKAQAVHDAMTGVDIDRVPASGPRGRRRTVWLLDAEAAARLPRGGS